MGVNASKPHPVETKWFPEYKEGLPSLEGKTVVITGTTTGTGSIVARVCVEKNCKNLLVLNRESDRSKKAEEDLKALVKEKGAATNVEAISCDLQDCESVRGAIKTIKDKYDSIDVLCNNAGVMALADTATKDGYDVQMQTNHLSHFLLTKELFPLLQKAKELRGEARIVHHSSGARHAQFGTGGGALKPEYFEKKGGDLGGDGSSMIFGGARWQRYHQTKLANSVFTHALSTKLKDTGIKAAVAAPGLAATNLQVTTGEGMGSSMWIMKFSQSAEDGAMPLLACCFDPATENGDFWEPNSIGNVKGLATKVKWDGLSTSEDSAKILWEKSEEACGKFDI